MDVWSLPPPRPDDARKIEENMNGNHITTTATTRRYRTLHRSTKKATTAFVQLGSRELSIGYVRMIGQPAATEAVVARLCSGSWIEFIPQATVMEIDFNETENGDCKLTDIYPASSKIALSCTFRSHSHRTIFQQYVRTIVSSTQCAQCTLSSWFETA